MWHWDKEVNDDFTGDFGRHRTWRSANSGLRHRYGGHGGHFGNTGGDYDAFYENMR